MKLLSITATFALFLNFLFLNTGSFEKKTKNRDFNSLGGYSMIFPNDSVTATVLNGNNYDVKVVWDNTILITGGTNPHFFFFNQWLIRVNSNNQHDTILWSTNLQDTLFIDSTSTNAIDFHYLLVRNEAGGHFVDTSNTISRRTVSLMETKKQSKLNLYPNPALNQISFNFEVNSTDQVNFVLYDLQGKLIQQEQLQVGNEHQIILQKDKFFRKNQLYTYQIENSTGAILSGKLLVE